MATYALPRGFLDGNILTKFTGTLPGIRRYLDMSVTTYESNGGSRFGSLVSRRQENRLLQLLLSNTCSISV